MSWDWDKAKKGALAGGLGGAVVGGPFGAGVGAVGGGFVGGFGGLDAFGFGDAPHADTVHLSTKRADYERMQAQESRGEQQGLGDFWRNQMAGKGPSVAELQLRQGAQMAGQQARATAASARGANMALAGRGAAIGSSNAVMNVNNQAAQLRAGEQLAGAQQYQQLLQAQRQQDLMARGLSEQEAIAQLNSTTELSKANLDAESKQRGAGLGFIGGALGTLGGISDERTKRDVVQVGGDDSVLSDTLTKDNVLPYGAYDVPPPTASFPVGPGGTVPRVETAYDAAPPPSARYADAPSAAPRFAPNRMAFRPQDTAQLSAAHGFGPDTNPLAPELRTADYMSKGAGPESIAAVNEEMGLKGFKDFSGKRPGDEDDDKKDDKWARGLGGAAQLAIGLSMMSDKQSKEDIRDLTLENLTLRRTMAKAGKRMLETPEIRAGIAGGLRYGTERASGAAAMDTLDPETQQHIAKLVGDRGSEGLTGDAQRDYARRLQNYRQAAADMEGDIARASYEEQQGRRREEMRRREEARADELVTEADTRRGGAPPRALDPYRTTYPLGALTSDSMAKRDIFGVDKLPPAEYPHPRSPDSVGRLPDLTRRELELLQRGPTAPRAGDEHMVSRAFAPIPAKAWNYKPEFAAEANASRGLPPDDEFGRRRQVGPMAQDLELVPILAPAVKEGPDGVKRVDTGRVAMTSAAAIGDLSRRLDELEGLKLREMKAAGGKGRRR